MCLFSWELHKSLVWHSIILWVKQPSLSLPLLACWRPLHLGLLIYMFHHRKRNRRVMAPSPPLVCLSPNIMERFSQLNLLRIKWYQLVSNWQNVGRPHNQAHLHNTNCLREWKKIWSWMGNEVGLTLEESG